MITLLEDFVRRAQIIRWVDADTLDVLVDLGFHISLKQRVRMYGINCPEKNTEAGKAAIAFVKVLLPVGSTVTIRSYRDAQEEKYGRWLAEVQMDDGRMVSEYLINSGHGVAYFGGSRTA